MKKTVKRLAVCLWVLCLLCLPVLAGEVNGWPEDGNYYAAQLEGDARRIFDILCQQTPTLEIGDDIVIPMKELEVTREDLSSNSAFHKKWDTGGGSSAWKEMSVAFCQAYAAFDYDRPELSWALRTSGVHELMVTRADGSELPSGGTVRPGHYVFNLRIRVRAPQGYGGAGRSFADDRQAIARQTDAILAQAEGLTAPEQIALFNRWLCANNRYNTPASKSDPKEVGYAPWNPVSALEEGLSPVCEGYSRAFKILCDRMDIPCILVSGSGHMWNYVRLGREWYAVDVTANDGAVLPGGEVSQRYLLTSTAAYEKETPRETLYWEWSGREDSGKTVRQDIRRLYPDLSDKTFDPKTYVPAQEQSALPAFSDVPADSWFARSVGWAVETGVTAGTSGSTFTPGRTCTVQEILTFLWRSVGKPEGTGLPEDVPADAYYYEAARWALSAGLIPGSRLEGGRSCTRAMAVEFLWKAWGSPAPGAEAQFADVPAGASFAPAVAWAVETGVTKGTGGGLFSPDSTCDRATIVTFLWRAQ